MVVALQEFDSSFAQELLGWTVHASPNCPSAICLPNSVAPRSPAWFGRRSCSIVVGTMVIVSTYLPDISKTFEDFMDSVQDVDLHLDYHKRQGRRAVMWCGDFNLELAPGVGALTGTWARGKIRDSFDVEKQNAILSTATKFSLRALNTFSGDHGEQLNRTAGWCEERDATRYPWGVRALQIGRGTQLDYIFVSDCILGEAWPVRRMPATDHLLLAGSLKIIGRQRQLRRSNKFSLTGWRPSTSQALHKFQELVMTRIENIYSERGGGEREE